MDARRHGHAREALVVVALTIMSAPGAAAVAASPGAPAPVSTVVADGHEEPAVTQACGGERRAGYQGTHLRATHRAV